MKQLFLTSSADYVAESVAKKIGEVQDKKLVFINTPVEGEESDDYSWMDDDRNALKRVGFETTDYTITNKGREQIQADLEPYEVIYVSGGNSYYFLDKARETGFDKLIVDWVNTGKIYIGTSCGSIVAGVDINPARVLEDVAKAPGLKDTRGFGLVNLAVLPHWGSKSFKQRYLKPGFAHTYDEKIPVLLLSNYEYLWVKNDWYKVVDVREENKKLT